MSGAVRFQSDAHPGSGYRGGFFLLADHSAAFCLPADPEGAMMFRFLIYRPKQILEFSTCTGF